MFTHSASLNPIAVRRYLTLMAGSGFDNCTALNGAGIKADQLEGASAGITRLQSRTVIRNMLHLNKGIGVGFDAGLQTDLPSLGVVGHAVMSSKSMRDTHVPWLRYGEVLSGIAGSAKILDETNQTVTLLFECGDRHDPLLPFYAEEFLGMLQSVGPMLTGAQVPIDSVALEYAPPAYASTYNSSFGVHLEH